MQVPFRLGTRMESLDRWAEMAWGNLGALPLLVTMVELCSRSPTLSVCCRRRRSLSGEGRCFGLK